MKKSMFVLLLAAAVLTGTSHAEEAASFPAGYRASSLWLPTHEIAFIKKGDRLDVMVTFDAMMKGGSKEKVTATILQNVLVWDVQKPERIEANGALELILNPNETQYLSLAQRQGDITVALRPAGDTKMTPMEMASLRKLFK